MVTELKEIKMTKPKKIPISTAKQISKDFNYPEIVIFAYDPVSGKQHITTYGKNKEMCKDAAKAAEYLKKALHWNIQPEKEFTPLPDVKVDEQGRFIKAKPLENDIAQFIQDNIHKIL